MGHLVKMANIMLLPKWELPNNGSNQYFLVVRLWWEVQLQFLPHVTIESVNCVFSVEMFLGM
jgi:hypothetical protein